MEGSQWPKILVAVVLLGVAGTYGYSQYSKLRPNEAINNNVSGEFEDRRQPDPERREQFQREMATAANISPDQQRQLEKIREEADGDWRQMREKMAEVLTPEQQQKLRENFRARGEQRMAQRMAEARAAMSPSDYEQYRQRMEERRQQRGNRGGGGGERRGGGERGGPR